MLGRPEITDQLERSTVYKNRNFLLCVSVCRVTCNRMTQAVKASLFFSLSLFSFFIFKCCTVDPQVLRPLVMNGKIQLRLTLENYSHGLKTNFK